MQLPHMGKLYGFLQWSDMTVVALDLKDASAHIVSQRMHMDIALDQSLRGIEMPEDLNTRSAWIGSISANPTRDRL